MAEYKPNSNKFKEEQRDDKIGRKVEKIIAGSAKLKKKSEIKKFVGLFNQDEIRDIKAHIVADIIIPAVKDILLDTVKTVLSVNSQSSDKGYSSKVSYKSYYQL
ncbi:hypothetical protein FACS1894132_04840 [Clostridia bacterium]|nr:hypothetical protein FACS1894132_04840 [Clostridia bacterium]